MTTASYYRCLLNKIFLSSEPFWHHTSHGSFILTCPHLFLSRTGEPCRHTYSNYLRPSPLPTGIDINPFCFMGTFALFTNIKSTSTIFTWWDSLTVKRFYPYQKEPHNLTGALTVFTALIGYWFLPQRPQTTRVFQAIHLRHSFHNYRTSLFLWRLSIQYRDKLHRMPSVLCSTFSLECQASYVQPLAPKLNKI